MTKKVPENQMPLPLDFSATTKQVDGILTPPPRPPNMAPMIYNNLMRDWPLVIDGRVITDLGEMLGHVSAQQAREEATDSYTRRD